MIDSLHNLERCFPMIIGARDHFSFGIGLYYEPTAIFRVIRGEQGSVPSAGLKCNDRTTKNGGLAPESQQEYKRYYGCKETFQRQYWSFTPRSLQRFLELEKACKGPIKFPPRGAKWRKVLEKSVRPHFTSRTRNSLTDFIFPKKFRLRHITCYSQKGDQQQGSQRNHSGEK